MENDIRICVGCGKEFIPTRSDKKFCCRACAKRFNAKAAKAKAKRDRPAMIECPHNEGVVCDKQECNSCGWNPGVAHRRMRAIQRVLREGQEDT